MTDQDYLFLDMQFHQLYLRHSVLDDLKLIFAYGDNLIELGETLIIMKDKAADRLVLITLRQIPNNSFT